MTKERLEDTAGPASVPDEQEPEQSGGSPSTRRRFIRAAAASMGAFALFGLVERGSAEAKKDDDEGKGKGKNDKTLRLGKENTAKKQTSLTSDDDTLTLKVENTGDGQALFGRADSAFGVHGVSVSSAGVRAFSAEFKGLLAEGAVIGADGFALEGLGVKGSSPLGQGIAGVSGTPPPPPPGPPPPPSPPPPIGVSGESFRTGGIGVVGKGPVRGVDGSSKEGTGVKGLTSAFGQNGVIGEAPDGIGAQGVSKTLVGVKGFAGDVASPAAHTTGVLGVTIAGDGVKGFTGAAAGNGVVGEAPAGIGVHAISSGGVGLKAFSSTGTALQVAGRATFSSAGVINVDGSGDTFSVSGVPGAAPGALVALVLATVQDASVGAAISYARVSAPGAVEIKMTATPGAGRVAFFVVN